MSPRQREVNEGAERNDWYGIKRAESVEQGATVLRTHIEYRLISSFKMQSSASHIIIGISVGLYSCFQAYQRGSRLLGCESRLGARGAWGWGVEFRSLPRASQTAF